MYTLEGAQPAIQRTYMTGKCEKTIQFRRLPCISP